MAEPAGGVLPRLDKGGADAAPLEPLEDLEMVEHGHAWEVVTDLRLVGRAAVQEHIADRPAVEPGDQQHPASVLLPGQPVGEEVSLPEDRHQRGEIGRSGSPDLHRTQGSAVVRLLEAAPHPATLAGPGDHVTAFWPRP
jgi:hypothetical protein